MAIKMWNRKVTLRSLARLGEGYIESNIIANPVNIKIGGIIFGIIFRKKASQHTRITASHIIQTNAFNRPNSKSIEVNHGNNKPIPCNAAKLPDNIMDKKTFPLVFHKRIASKM